MNQNLVYKFRSLTSFIGIFSLPSKFLDSIGAQSKVLDYCQFCLYSFLNVKLSGMLKPYASWDEGGILEVVKPQHSPATPSTFS